MSGLLLFFNCQGRSLQMRGQRPSLVVMRLHSSIWNPPFLSFILNNNKQHSFYFRIATSCECPMMLSPRKHTIASAMTLLGRHGSYSCEASSIPFHGRYLEAASHTKSVPLPNISRESRVG